MGFRAAFIAEHKRLALDYEKKKRRTKTQSDIVKLPNPCNTCHVLHIVPHAQGCSTMVSREGSKARSYCYRRFVLADPCCMRVQQYASFCNCSAGCRRNLPPRSYQMQESSPHKRILVGSSSPFMRVAEHLTALRARC